MNNKGKLLISLDFELFWGVRDKRSIASYNENLSGTYFAIDSILTLFKTYRVNATWSTVGLLMCESVEEMLEFTPSSLPTYLDFNLSPYKYLNDGWCESENLYHMAKEKIDDIYLTEGQSIGTHTYSHYYALEGGQRLEQFSADISSAKALATKRNIQIKSIVFPRNQFNSKYSDVLVEHGIKAYRGNEHSWIYKESAGEDESKFKRLARLADSYINISGHNTFSISSFYKFPLNLPSSRFLRPYNHEISMFDWLRLRRIKRSMTYAAKHNEVFHLWWHPHNFGSCTENNIDFLRKILEHFEFLKIEYGMDSCSMEDIIQLVEESLRSEG